MVTFHKESVCNVQYERAIDHNFSITRATDSYQSLVKPFPAVSYNRLLGHHHHYYLCFCPSSFSFLKHRPPSCALFVEVLGLLFSFASTVMDCFVCPMMHSMDFAGGCWVVVGCVAGPHFSQKSQSKKARGEMLDWKSC